MTAAGTGQRQVEHQRAAERLRAGDGEAAGGEHVGVEEVVALARGFDDDEARARRDADVAARGKAVTGSQPGRGGDAGDVGAVAAGVLLAQRHGRGRAGGLGEERGVDLVAQPDGAAPGSQFGMASVVGQREIEQGVDARGAAGVAQVGVARVGAGVDDRHQGATAVEPGGGARGRSADRQRRLIERGAQEVPLVDLQELGGGQEAAQRRRVQAQAGHVAAERQRVESEPAQGLGAAGDARGDGGAAVA